MKDISRFIDGESGMELSNNDQSAEATDWSNSIFNCIIDGSRGYIKEQQFWETVAAMNQQINNNDIQRLQELTDDSSSKQTKYNIQNQDMNNSSQDIEYRMRWNEREMFEKHSSEINWDSISKNLVDESGAERLTSYPFELVDSEHTGDPRIIQRIYLQNLAEENGRWYSYNNNQVSNGDQEHFVSNNELEKGVMVEDEIRDPSEARCSADTAIAWASRIYSQGYGHTTPGVMIPCRGEETNSPDGLCPSTFSEHRDYLPNPSRTSHAEGDYLFSEALVQKWKFRLLINRERETQLRAEIYPHGLSLSDMIVMKYRANGIPVEVEAYRRKDRDIANVQAFNIIFENERDVRKAFDLVEKGQLFFSLRAARPSPTYHVKYEVIHPAGVFEGKCFRQQQIHQLWKGDIVTANQIKGNKVRIIKYCPVGCKIEFDVHGWVLLQKKDMDLLRRMDYREEQEPVGKPESRSNVGKPLWQNPQIPRQQRSTVQNQLMHKANPQRVSATNCSPFEVLVEVEVRKGRKEPAIVGRLKPGNIVWANQHKGSMLRIMKMDHSGNIVYGSTFKPEVWGWVCLQRRGDEKPRLARIINSLVTKTNKNGRFQSPLGLRRTGHIFTDCQRQYPARISRSTLKSRASKVAKVSSRAPNEKHFNSCRLHNADESSSESHFVKSKVRLNYKEDLVVSASSPGCSQTQLIFRHGKRGDGCVSEKSDLFVSSRINLKIPRDSRNMRGHPKPYHLAPPVAINYSPSQSPMSTSSISTTPVSSKAR